MWREPEDWPLVGALCTTERVGPLSGSDARVIMGTDEAALLRLWREKRGEVEPEDLSRNLIVQLGLVTEELSGRFPFKSSKRGGSPGQPATIRSDGPGAAERSFRYAPLSSGLDIVRKTSS